MSDSMHLGARYCAHNYHPFDHGSTLGGNALGAAIGLEALIEGINVCPN